MKIYLSGGMRTGWQDAFHNRYPNIEFIDPRFGDQDSPKAYTKWDMDGIEESDAVIAYLEEKNPSGLGLSFEIGYARGLGKFVFFVCEKDDKYAKILEHASNWFSKDLADLFIIWDLIYKVGRING